MNTRGAAVLSAALQVTLFGWGTVALAGAAHPDSVSPSFGWPDRPTPISVAGEDIAPGDTLRLAAGGPRRIGRLETAGQTVDVAVENGIACLAEGYDGLRVVDVQNPAAPRTLATALVGTPVSRVAVNGGIAFLAAGSLGVFSVDVRRPEAPIVLGHLPGLPALALAVDERYVYVAAATRGLVVVDRADPSALQIVGEVATGGYALALAVHGERALVLHNGDGVASIALDDPAAPRILGVAPLADPQCVAFVGPHASVSTDRDGLFVLRVTGSGAPRTVGRMPRGEQGFAMAAYRRFALVSGRGRGLDVADLADPRQPRLASHGPMASSLGIAVNGDLAFVATGSGMDVIDLTEPASPAPSSLFEVRSERILPVVPAGPVAYVGTNSGLIVLDVTDPVQPRTIGELGDLEDVKGFAARPGRAFLRDGSGVLRVVDLEDPRAPRAIGQTVMPGFSRATAIAAADPWIYVGQAGALGIVDASDPTAPQFLGSTPLPWTSLVWDMTTDDRHLYVAALEGGLYVLDREIPAAPRLVGTIPPRQWAVAVAVAGRFAFVAEWEAGLSVYDVSLPSAPRLIGQADTPGRAWDVAVDGSIVLVADDDAGVLVFDVGDPSRPVLVERRWTQGAPHAIAAVPGLALGRNEQLGVELVRLTPPLADGAVISPTEIRAVVPPGLETGIYDVTLTDRARRLAVLPNSFTVCGGTSLQAALLPEFGATAHGYRPDTPWQLVVEAAAAARARLRLPPLPDPPDEVRFEPDPSADPRRTIVEIHSWPEGDALLVVLRGADETRARAAWQAALRDGGFSLPRIDERSFGPMRLALGEQPPAGTAVRIPLPGSGTARVSSPQLVRIELTAGHVDAAGAWGPGSDLVFEAFPADADACLAPSTTGFADTLFQSCLALLDEHPELWLDCSRFERSAARAADR